jgi:hypothetical protein
VREAAAWLKASAVHVGEMRAPHESTSDCLAVLCTEALPEDISSAAYFARRLPSDARLAELWFPGLATPEGYVEQAPRAKTGHHKLDLPCAREILGPLEIHSVDEWNALRRTSRVPSTIPQRPDRFYRHAGWSGWAHFFSQTKLQRHRTHPYPSYEELRAFFRAHKLPYGGKSGYFNFRSGLLRQEHAKLPECPNNFPTRPHLAYGQKWRGWDDLLGVPARVKRIRCVAPFSEARAFVRTLKLANVHEFQMWRVGKMPGMVERPDNIPSNPQVTYQKSGWSGYSDFLGTKPRGNRKT